MNSTGTIRPESAKPPPKTKLGVTPSWVGRVPQLKPGRYADGLPLHPVEYLCCKLMLRPNHFTSRQSLFDFTKVLNLPASSTMWVLRRRGFTMSR